MSRLFTSESVTEGHPDKICDQISDAILDDMLRQDPQARVAVETMVTTGLVHVAGEVRTSGYSDVARIVRAQEDAANGGLRREPELPEHVAIAPETAAPPAQEFAIVDDERDDAARQAAVRRRMQGLARQASLDPGDGIDEE